MDRKDGDMRQSISRMKTLDLKIAVKDTELGGFKKKMKANT